MALNLTNIREKLQQKLPTRSLLLLPGEYFFGRSVSLPEGIAQADIPSFAELTVEGISPFPIEQLLWGFLHHSDSGHIYIYATSQGRVKNGGFEGLDQYQNVFPSFVAGFGRSYSRPTLSFLASEGTFSALFFQANDPVPVQIHSMALPEPAAGLAELKELRQEWLKKLPAKDYSLDDAILRASAPVMGRSSIAIPLREVGEEGKLVWEQPLPYDIDSIWNLDVRDAAFAERERRNRRKSEQLWRSVVYSGIAALILFILQLSMFGWGYLNKYRQEKIVRQAPDVAALIFQSEQAGRIESLFAEQLRPFAMLNTLNEGRPSALYFKRVSATSWNELRVEGEAGNLEEVNQYRDTLAANPYVIDLVPEMASRQGKAQFTFVIKFNPLPPESDPVGPEPEATEQPESAPPAETAALPPQ